MLRLPRWVVPLLQTLTLTFTLLGCQSIEVWDRGYPKDATHLTTEQRRIELAKFRITKITHQYVEVDDKRYSRSSFAPIFKHVTPGASPKLAEADEFADRMLYVSALVLSAATYTVPDGVGPYTMLRNGVLAVGIIGETYEQVQADNRYDQAIALYEQNLSRHIGSEYNPQ